MTLLIEDYSPIAIGDTGAPFVPTFQHKDGTLVDLTGTTISMKLQNKNDPALVITCTGTWTINADPTTGKASYAYTSTDVATAGDWLMFITITKSGKPLHADTKVLSILPAP